MFLEIRSQMKKAFALFELLAKKDILTAHHSLNVACLTKVLAAEYINADIGKDTAFIAGLLHDIGKMKMPDYVFGNHIITGQEEKKTIMQHPHYSKKILEDFNFDPIIITAAYQHHERLDGSGYPSGIKELEIIPIARLLGIVDSFSAIMEDRPYRKGAETRKAIEILLRDQGLYDTDMLTVFIKNINQVLSYTRQEVESYKRRFIHGVRAIKTF